MNGQAIIDRARRLAYVDSTQYTNSQAEEDMNIVYHDIENTIITEVGEDFFWNTFTSDIVANQSEYTLPTETSGNLQGLYKLLNVSAKLTSTGSFTKLEPKYLYELPYDISAYEDGGENFYIQADNSIFLYPTPSENITGGLKLTGIQNLIDVSSATTEANIFNGRIQAKFHNILAQGMVEYIYRGRGLVNQANEARARYLELRSKLVEYLGDRNAAYLKGDLPDLTYLSN